MRLRFHLSSNRPPPRWLIVVLAVAALAVLALGRASAPASAGVADYQPKLYLSGATSAVIGSAYQLINSQGVSTTARPTPTAVIFCSSCSGNLALVSSTAYSYRYTLVDATGGESSPSGIVTAANVLQGEITVGGLPTGVTVRLYRATTTNGPWKRVVELTNNASSTYLDNVPDASLGVLLPQAQTRTTLVTGTGWYEFAPGNALTTSANTGDFPAKLASPAFDGKGWVVDHAGGVSFAAGSWSITVKITSQAGNGTAGLDIGMWKVNDSGAVTGTLVDPTCSVSPCGSGGQPGSNPSGANIATVAGTASPITSTFASMPAFSLARNEHIYVEFWRHQMTASSGTTISTLAAYDGVATITHPAANGFPDVPALGSTAAYVNATPQLSATYTDPDADTGTMSFQLRSDNNCSNTGTAIASTTTGVLASGANANWTPPVNLANKALYPDGTYYWCVQSTDSPGNISGWSNASSFIVDTVPPTVSNVTTSNGTGAYNAGKTIHVQVAFGEPVNVTGSPKLALNTTPAESATYVSGSGTSTLTFDYTVGATDNVGALDYTGTGALTLNGGTIADLATNTAILTLAAPGSAGSLSANQSVRIDTVPPTVSSVTASNANGAYNAGKTIHVQVAFGEPVNVTGSPKLALNTTPAESATYVSGSGTSTLTFDYTVGATDNVGALDYTGTGALTLNGGTIADLAGNAGTLTLAVPGAAGSLGASKSLRIDTNPPGTPTLGTPADGSYLKPAPALHATFVNGDVGDTGTLDFRICSDSACVSVVQSGASASGLLNGGSGSWTPAGLADGTYFWEASGVDAAGNQSGWTTARTFTLDTTAPTAPALGAVAARIKITPQLSATFADPGGGATDSGTLLFQLCSDAACATVLQSNTQSGLANNATVTWTPTSLADGAYYFRVKSTDSAGNASWSATTPTFTVDTVAPAKPALGSPASATRVNGIPQLNATFTNSDPTDSGTVTFQLCSDAACATVIGTGTSATVGSGAAVSWTPAGPLADGTYYWRASSLDAAGNQGAWSSIRNFVLDTTGPNVPTLTGVAAHINAVPILSASFSDPDGAPDTGTLSFQVCSDAACTAVVQSGSSPAGVANGANGSWKPAGLAQGAYYWRTRAQDAAGNQSAWSGTQQFTLDTTAPVLPTTASPLDGVRLNQPPELSAVYNDSGGGTGSLTFEICATSSCSSPLLTNSGTSGGLAAGATGSWTPPFLFDGLYYWRVESTDSAGNVSGWSTARSFTVDATPPEPPLLALVSGSRVQADPVLAARVDDGTDAGDSFRIFVQVCGDAACSTVVTSGYSGTVPMGTMPGWTPPAPLADGTYYWRALAEDIVGNRSGWSATRSFIVDTVAPSVPTQGGLGDGAVVSQPRLSGTFSSSDPGDSGTLTFQLCTDAACTNVVATGSSSNVAPGGTASWTPDTAVLDDGPYFWRVQSDDAAGNASGWSSTRSFTLDQTPPGRPQDFKARVTGRLLTLSWRPPAGPIKVRAYALIVNGRRTRTLTSTTLKLRIRLQRHDRRSFAVAAIDPAGNVSEATRTIAAVAPPPPQKHARAATARHHP